MTTYLKRTDKTVDALIKATFPEYRGQRVQAIISDTVRFYGTMWDEGNRRTYALVRLADMTVMSVQQAPFLQDSELHTKYHNIPEGFVVVVNVDSRVPHIEIITHAANITPMLPAPVELTSDEIIVLTATRSLKSTYAGIPNYRFHNAHKVTGITSQRWEAAKALLISKGYLNKAGAITVDGRNVDKGKQLYQLVPSELVGIGMVQ